MAYMMGTRFAFVLALAYFLYHQSSTGVLKSVTHIREGYFTGGGGDHAIDLVHVKQLGRIWAISLISNHDDPPKDSGHDSSGVLYWGQADICGDNPCKFGHIY